MTELNGTPQAPSEPEEAAEKAAAEAEAAVQARIDAALKAQADEYAEAKVAEAKAAVEVAAKAAAEAQAAAQANAVPELTAMQLRVTNKGARAMCHVTHALIPANASTVITYKSMQDKALAKGNFAQINALKGTKRFEVEG
jgi:membrane protein involved in colicin uptake